MRYVPQHSLLVSGYFRSILFQILKGLHNLTEQSLCCLSVGSVPLMQMSKKNMFHTWAKAFIVLKVCKCLAELLLSSSSPVLKNRNGTLMISQ